MIEINRFVHAVIDLWLRQSKKALPIRLDDFGRPQQEFLDFLKGFFVLARARMLLLALIEIASVLLCCKPLAISPLCPAPAEFVNDDETPGDVNLVSTVATFC